MRHAEVSAEWHPVRARREFGHRPQGVLMAFAFNLCLLLLPLSAAFALVVIARDHLYAYSYSDSSARAIAMRVARLNGGLIQLDFDRQNQWNDLVDLELRSADMNAARGFLLSAPGMLPHNAAEVLHAQDASDAELEVAALQLLTPSTRARYVGAGPLISDRRGRPRALPAPEPLGTQGDFELLARAMLADHETDPLQFILTGYSLGLGGDLSPRMARGALALLDASRREDYSSTLGDEISALFSSSVPIDAFRAAATAHAQGDAAGAFANSSAAFRAALDPDATQRTRALLDELGAISELTSRSAAAALLTHATTLRDMPRVMLLAEAAGDRIAAAAKRLPHDGRLLNAARGQLTMNRELTLALAVAALAGLGLVLIVIFKLVQIGLGAWRRIDDDGDGDGEYAGELVELGGGNNWRPL